MHMQCKTSRNFCLDCVIFTVVTETFSDFWWILSLFFSPSSDHACPAFLLSLCFFLSLKFEKNAKLLLVNEQRGKKKNRSH